VTQQDVLSVMENEMSNCSTHCRDPYCMGCECSPECGYWDEQPNVLAERNRIIELLQDGAYLCGKGSREYGVRCAWKIANGECRCKDIIALIKGEK
jgi:hypothetical protein